MSDKLITCKECGEVIDGEPYQDGAHYYCSDDCRYALENQECSICGEALDFPDGRDTCEECDEDLEDE